MIGVLCARALARKKAFVQGMIEASLPTETYDIKAPEATISAKLLVHVDQQIAEVRDPSACARGLWPRSGRDRRLREPEMPTAFARWDRNEIRMHSDHIDPLVFRDGRRARLDRDFTNELRDLRPSDQPGNRQISESSPAE